MNLERAELYDLYAAYGALIDAGDFDSWLGLFAANCSYHIVPRENWERGLLAGLVYCDSRAMLEDRIGALREANKYNIHWDRHVVGLPRIVGHESGMVLAEAAFVIFQTDQEGESRLFAAGLYKDRLVIDGGALKFREKLVLLDTFAVPSLLSTPL